MELDSEDMSRLFKKPLLISDVRFVASTSFICQRIRISHLIWLFVILGLMSSFYTWVRHGRKGEGV